MKISKAHSLFNTMGRMGHLGPNKNTVLNFWLFLDSLTKEQWDNVRDRYNEVSELKREQTNKVVKFLKEQDDGLYQFLLKYHSWWEEKRVWKSYAGYCPCYATMEIIHSQKMIDTDLPLIYLPLFENV